MRHAFAILALLLSAAAHAAEHNTPADVAISCNQSGAVVTLGRNTIEPGATYYLGKDCDAFRPGVGTGRWWYAVSAFVIDINGRWLRFGGELGCQSLPYCRP